VRSRAEMPLATIALTVALVVAGPRPAAARTGQPSDRTNAENFAPAEIAGALAKAQADPNLATERTIKTLRWKESADEKPSAMPAWLAWIAGLFRFVEQSARMLIWCAALILVAVLAAYVVRVVRTRRELGGHQPFVAPTHVRDLDIRPESLPRDIGAAARALWERGEHRASLALLYRGMLSRLAHVHRVPIRDSSTEGDCLALAATHLPPRRRDYPSRLVGVWQRAVYGREEVPPALVYVLCDEFGAALEAAPAPDARSRGGAA
jgi:hypothetical protein